MERELSMANGGSLWGSSRREGRGGEGRHIHMAITPEKCRPLVWLLVTATPY